MPRSRRVTAAVAGGRGVRDRRRGDLGPLGSVAPPGGTIVVRFDQRPNPGADLQRLFFLQLRGDRRDDGHLRELADLLAFVATAGITPEIGLELPMERAEEGFRAMLEGDTSGKIVFTH
jgi:D-arabinose 1-dehydrogenase-like Zn-dependent alcohol dehydrogenase